MRILDLFKGNGPKADKPIELDHDRIDTWAAELAKHNGIGKELADFVTGLEEEKATIEPILKRFTDEGVLSSIPERARTMSALHGHEFASQTRKLLAIATFDPQDLFGFEKQQDAYLEANNAYKDLTAKNAAALREFFGDELKIVQATLQHVEDLIINLSGTLEQRKFPQIRKVKELQQRIAQTRDRSERYAKLLSSLEQDAARTKEKREKLEEGIREQIALIRNEQALSALQRAEKIEQELHDIAARYSSVCEDLRTTYKRIPSMKPSPVLKHIMDELPKDPLATLTQEAERVKEAFEGAMSQLEEENPGNVKNMITRLSKLAKEADATGRKVATTLPDQRALKRDIMKDIAALQAYDKQQFFMRARTEEEAIATKIAFLKEELDPAKLEAMHQELKALVRDLGATVKGEPADGKNERVERGHDPKDPGVDSTEPEGKKKKRN